MANNVKAPQVVPKSYKDAYWGDLIAQREKEYGLPSGLLHSIVNNGERTNNDQVSSAGARTVFQIIKPTRDAYLQREGIDAYLSPENAARVAALHLKESLDRNNGDVAAAAAEYHAGPNRKNWGDKTKAYQERVLRGMVLDESKMQQLMGRIDAWMQQNETVPTSGGPQGAGMPPGATQQASMEDLIRAADEFQKNPPKPVEAPQEPSLWERLKNAVTGSDRKTTATEQAMDIYDMPELNQLSWNSAKTVLGGALGGSENFAKTIQSNFPNVQMSQDEKGNYIFKSATDGKMYAIKPGLQGADIVNAALPTAAFVATTPVSAPTTLAGLTGLAAAGAATQAGIEGTKAALGGEADLAAIPTAGVLNAAIPAAGGALKSIAPAMGDAATAVKEAILNRGGKSAAPAVESAAAMRSAPFMGTVEGVAQPPNVAPTLTPAAVPELEAISDIARRAALTPNAKNVGALAAEAAPDQSILAAAKDLGVEDLLQPEHFTDSQPFRELVSTIKETPGSIAKSNEVAKLQELGERAQAMLEEFGGTKDLSTLSNSVKTELDTAIKQLQGEADKYYTKVRSLVGESTPVDLPNTSRYFEEQIKKAGGFDELTDLQKKLYKTLKLGGQQELELVGMSRSFADANPEIADRYREAIRKAIGSGGKAEKPTYFILNRERQNVQDSMNWRGEYKDAPFEFKNEMLKALRADTMEAASASSSEAAAALNLANRTAGAYKSLQDSATGLFGAQLAESLAPQLAKAGKDLAVGNQNTFLELLKKVPTEMRKDVAASTVMAAIGKSVRTGGMDFQGFTNWYEGILSKGKGAAYTALMTNLPEGAAAKLNNLYKVSRGITDSLQKTGSGPLIVEKMTKADNFIKRVYGRAVALPLHVAASKMGLQWTGIPTAVGSIVKGGKSTALTAADDLISSPEFKRFVVQGGSDSVKQFANSPAFLKYAKKIKLDVSEREKWILGALQATNNNVGENNGE